MHRIEIGQEEYPAALLDLRSPPRVLWAIGSLNVVRPPVVAIVGTRKATPYGLRATRAGGRGQNGRDTWDRRGHRVSRWASAAARTHP
jgi:hypothetical protein